MPTLNLRPCSQSLNSQISVICPPQLSARQTLLWLATSTSVLTRTPRALQSEESAVEQAPAAVPSADPESDFGATMVGPIDDREVTGSKELDAEDAAGTQPGLPDVAALQATIVPHTPDEADPADVNATQAWSPAPCCHTK
ncbi:MAG UNVERIFIED_CONTAM: hypothetical protein LVR18_15735 [Planctomycetaceae bacterium]